MHYQSQVAILEEGGERIALCNSDYESTLGEVKSRWRDEAYKKIERVNLLPLNDEYDLYRLTISEHLEQCSTTHELLSALKQIIENIDDHFDQQAEISDEIDSVFSKYNDSRRDAELTIEECHKRNEYVHHKMRNAVSLL